MRTFLKIIALVAVLVIICAGIAGRVVWTRVHEPFKGYTEAEQIVEIPQGTTTGEIGSRLVTAGIVKDRVVFRVALRLSGRSRTLQAGEYRFDRAMTSLEVVDKLARGDIYARRITFPEGLTISELAALYESNGFGPRKEFEEAARNASGIADLDPLARDLEGYLFPETYAVPRSTTASTLVATMVDRFRTTYSESLRQKAAERSLTTRQVVTLASLVEKETAKPEERPLVAAVYLNRMKQGMPMQADPTVVYALRKARKYDGNIRRTDLGFDSPYNTYKYAGLPPGPIASPGQASIEAVLTPASVRYLYFVSRNDGTHVFAETLKEHNANVLEYQVKFFQRQKQGDAGKAVPGVKRSS